MWAVEYCADSFAELKLIPDGEWDVTITDPPYDAKCQENQISGTDVAENGGGIGVPHLDLPFAPLEGYEFTKDLVRVSKRWALMFGTVESFGHVQSILGDAVMDEDGAYVRGGIWYKPNAQGQMTGDRPAACYEGVNVMHRPGVKVWNGHGSYAFWVCNGTRGLKDRHPNEKPVKLALKLIALFTNRGETVFDPFCGRGAIGEACLLLGRNYVGLDLPEHDWTHVVTRKVDGKRKRETIVERVDWVKKARVRLAEVEGSWGSVSDEDALKLCGAKKAEILEEAA